MKQRYLINKKRDLEKTKKNGVNLIVWEDKNFINIMGTMESWWKIRDLPKDVAKLLNNPNNTNGIILLWDKGSPFYMPTELVEDITSILAYKKKQGIEIFDVRASYWEDIEEMVEILKH